MRTSATVVRGRGALPERGAAGGASSSRPFRRRSSGRAYVCCSFTREYAAPCRSASKGCGSPLASFTDFRRSAGVEAALRVRGGAKEGCDGCRARLGVYIYLPKGGGARARLLEYIH